MKQVFFRFLPILILAINLFAQTDDSKFDFYSRGPYRTEVPRPQSILRFEVGTHHTTYAQMEQFIEKVAKSAPDRVKIFDIGLTNEHRMQHIVAISAPENMSRLDEIKANNSKLNDPRKTSPTEANSIIQNNPTISWMAYTIHGNESASFEAMMQVIYQLAASNEPATLDILKNNVTLIITGENPDGHERFATWYNSVAVGDANPVAIEHREPWSIYGRLNHYRFDLNRDNAVGTQIETQNMEKAFFDWNPQLAVDHHGQPSQYFFPPVALPINPNLPQPVTNKWMDIYGRANAAAFDSNRWDYYNRDIFDLFYVGYWDSMPSLTGAIGMTYETDGGGFKGINWMRDDGTIVTLRSAIAKHFVASMTTLETSAKNRQSRLKDYYDFRVSAINEGKTERMKRIVIIPDKDRPKTAELIEHLQRLKVEVNVANSSFSSVTAHNYEIKNAPAQSKNFPVGSYVIDLDQPNKRLIKAFLEQDTPQDKAFVDDNMGRFKRNEMRGKGQPKEQYGFYDITAWSLPLAFGIDAFWTEDVGNIGNAVTAEYLEAQKRGAVSGKAQIAYIISYENDNVGAMALRLLQEGFRVGVATRPMTTGNRNWKAGTFVIRISRNREMIHEAVNRLAREYGVNVTAVNSGYAEEGDTPIGGEAVAQMKRGLTVAMVAAEPVEQTSYGSLWWMLDRSSIKFTPMTLNSIKGGALKDYNVLIMPDGSAGDYFSQFGKDGVDSLRQWISNGGTLITVRGASVFAALKDVGFTSSKMVGSSEDEEKAKDGEEKTRPDLIQTEPKADKQDWKPAELPPIISPTANRGEAPEALPGAIMRATVDRTIWLNYGVDSNEIPVLLSSNYFFRFSKEGTNALLFAENAKRPLTMSGFIWEGNTERLLKGTAYLIDEPTGSGHVILFADEPFFRGIFRSTTRQFFNAIIFNGAF
ncbi:MAG TPA: M14 family zinc carboxypeptidase [Pyrinomonadaceae bacterium]|nr:M14 family zinc carboxypeptidase [Pyrinomonadaceae bacterium]